MDDTLRTLRGLAGVGATWAIAWGLIGAAVGAVVGLVSPDLWSYSNPVVDWALGMAAYGGVSGVGFGGLLAWHERDKSLGELSPARAALWGVLGAVAVPLLFALMGTFDSTTTALDLIEAMGLTAVLGGTFAGGSVALARAAPQPRELERGSGAPALEPPRYEPEALSREPRSSSAGANRRAGDPERPAR